MLTETLPSVELTDAFVEIFLLRYIFDIFYFNIVVFHSLLEALQLACISFSCPPAFSISSVDFVVELEIYDSSSLRTTRIAFFFKFSLYFLVHSLPFFLNEAALGLVHQ